MQTIASEYHVSTSTFGFIIKEVLAAIWKSLSLEALSHTDARKVAEGFGSTWDLPHCIGAVDGKRIKMEYPRNSNALSVVLLAACDANYCFTAADVAVTNEAGGDLKLLNSHNLPQPDDLPHSEEIFPYFYIGNETCTLANNFMVPFSKYYIEGSAEPDEKRAFNYRLSRALRVTENAFGLLTSRFRIFHRGFKVSPENAIIIVKACVALHNFIMKTKNVGVQNPPPGYYGDCYSKETGKIVVEGKWRSEEKVLEDVEMSSNAVSSLDAVSNRFVLSEYLNNTLPLPYQRDHALKGGLESV